MDTIKQKHVEVILSDDSRIKVRRMKWKAAREFLKQFADVATKIMRRGEPGVTQDLLGALPAIIGQSEELILHLALSSSDLTPDKLDDMEMLDVLRVIEAAITINLDEELKNFCAGIGAKVGALTSERGATTTK